MKLVEQTPSDAGNYPRTGRSKDEIVHNSLNINEHKYIKEIEKNCVQSFADKSPSSFKIAQGSERFLSLRNFDGEEAKYDNQPLSLQEELQLSIETVVADEANKITRHYNG